MRPLCDLSRDELVQWCHSHSQPAYRAAQIWRWLFGKRISNFESMCDVSGQCRQQLAQEFVLFSTKIVERRTARDRTEKLLVELCDGQHIECVLMRELGRRTVCISTQVGCAMGCVFCASGLLGLKRNLSTGEILEQVLQLDRLLERNEKITNLVVMGIGEPLANLQALIPALNALHDNFGLGLGARRMTVSTVGLPDKIREFANVGKPYTLAVSLHAPNDELRNELVAVNENIGIRSILEATDEYFKKTGRRVTYEYVLLSGINDQPTHAHQLIALLKPCNAHVNLIPMNLVESLSFDKPTERKAQQFADILNRGGITTTVRKRKGADIDAACGQLRLTQESSFRT